MKIFIFITCLIAVSFTSFGATPPDAVAKAVKHQFSNATHVVWGKENAKEWEANFALQKTKISANVSSGGRRLDTETEIPFTQLPEKMTSAIELAQKWHQIIGAYKIESAKSGISYEADLKKGKQKKEVIYKPTARLLIKFFSK